jgi:GNAT superfamily N-acetyltransferase
MREHFGSGLVAVGGHLRDTSQLPGFVAIVDGEPVGLIQHLFAGEVCEIIALVVTTPRHGVGRRLVDEVAMVAAAVGATRLLATTTNDNLLAEAFYSACGFVLSETRVGAVESARDLKPEIPRFGHGGVAIEDELDYMRALGHT